LDLKYFIVSTLVWIHTTKNKSVCQLSQEQTLNLGPDRSSFKGPCYLTYKGLILVPQLAWRTLVWCLHLSCIILDQPC